VYTLVGACPSGRLFGVESSCPVKGSTGGLLPPAVAAESLRLAAAGSHLLRMSDPFSPIQLLRL
jgi:hypothetical protein